MTGTGKAIQLTDVAEELATLWRGMFQIKGSDNRPTYTVLAEWCNTETTAYEFPRILGAISRKIAGLSELIASSDHPLLAASYRRDLLGALSNMNAPLLPSSMNSDWKTNPAKVHPSEVGLLGSFSHIARSYRPLRVLSAEDVEALLTGCKHALSELDSSTDVVPWARQLMRSGLSDLIFSLERIPILGHELANDEIESLFRKSSLVQARLKADGGGVANEGGKASVLKVLNLAMFALNLVAVPPQAEEYAGWYVDKLASAYTSLAISGPLEGQPPAGRANLQLMLPKREEENDRPKDAP